MKGTTRDVTLTRNTTCITCNGSGRLRTTKLCAVCDGSGSNRETTAIVVTVPAGCYDDMTLRLPHKGDDGSNGGARGHLYVKLKVLGDRRFRRLSLAEAETEGTLTVADVFTDTAVTVTTAMLGGFVNVPVVTGGEVRVKVDAGVQHGDRRRLRGKGLKLIGAADKEKHGDQYVVFLLQVPKSLTAAQRAAAEALHVALGGELSSTRAAAATAAEKDSSSSSDSSNADGGLFSRMFNNKKE